MKKKRLLSPGLSTRLKLVFGLVLLALLGVATAISFGSSVLTGQTGTSPGYLAQIPNHKQGDPTPGSAVLLPLISQSEQTDSLVNTFRPDEIIRQASIVMRAEKEWETYVDPSYGYSVQYPKGWYLRPTPVGAAWHGGTAHIATFDPTIEGSEARERELAELGYVKIDIGVSMTSRLPDESLEEWLARREDPTAVHAAATMEQRAIKGSNELAIVKVFALDSPDSLSTQIIYVPKGDKVYYVSIFELPYNSQYHEFIDKILGSFTLEPDY